MAYWGKANGKWNLVVADSNGTTQETHGGYDDYCDGTLVFSRNGRRLAFVGVRNGKATVVVDGSEGPLSDGILRGTPIFSFDSRGVTYAAFRRGRWQIVVNGTTKYSFPLIKEYTVQFTPDGQNLICLASFDKDDGRLFAVAVDGRLTRDYLFPAASVLIPNGLSTFHAIVVEGTVKHAVHPEDETIEGSGFVRLNMDTGASPMRPPPRGGLFRRMLSQ